MFIYVFSLQKQFEMKPEIWVAVFYASALLVLVSSSIGAFIGYKRGQNEAFAIAVKNCSYEPWMCVYSVNFQALARVAFEHIQKERYCPENEELNALLRHGPNEPDDVRKIQEYIFSFYVSAATK